MSTWHLTPQTLTAYREDDVDPVLAASVEAHLLGCADCRADLAKGAGPTAAQDSDRRWAALTEVVDAPARTPLARLGLSTGPLVAAWAVALGLLVLVPTVPAVVVGSGLPTLLLALAPLAPTAAVVLAFRVGSDPAGEMALATPVAGLRLVSRRALLVGAVALPLGVLAALLTGSPTAVALAWILPGLALSALVLLAGTTRLDPAYAAAGLGGTWALAVGIPSAARRSAADLVAVHIASPTFQLTALVVALAALALTVSRRERIAYRRTA